MKLERSTSILRTLLRSTSVGPARCMRELLGTAAAFALGVFVLGVLASSSAQAPAGSGVHASAQPTRQAADPSENATPPRPEGTPAPAPTAVPSAVPPASPPAASPATLPATPSQDRSGEARPDDAASSATAPQSAKETTPEYGAIHAVFLSMSGEIRVRLHVAESPRTCANFINLVRRGYYTRKPWTDFSPVVRQLGSPLPPNEIPYSIPLEFSPKEMFDVGGRLCLANTSEEPGARGHPCRVFLTVKPQERWNLVYVIFGTVDRGLEVAQRLTEGELIEEIRIVSEREGDVERLLKAYERSIARWNASLEKKPLK